MDVYLSAAAPRWSPRSESDLRRAVDEGLIGETHHVDAKREIGSGPSKNKELARDLASFAVDGGTLLIGVGEDKAAGRFTLAPQPLEGLAERVDQVARSVPDPPLTILTERIPSDDDPAVGYLLVHVPPSANAPHMVDNRYYGRSDTTRYALSDSEVMRLHERRRATESDVDRLLEAEIARDPIPPAQRERAHLFLLAEPLTPQTDMLVELLDGAGWEERFRTLLAATDTPAVREALKCVGGGGFYPGIGNADRTHRRSRGAAASSPGITVDRRVEDIGMSSVENAVDLEVHFDGGVRIFMARLSDGAQPKHPRGEQYTQVIFDAGVVIYARRFLALVAAVADAGGYFGGWALGMAATGLRGHPAYSREQHWTSASVGPRGDEDQQRRVTTASYAELVKRPGAVTDRLIGRLLRAYDVRERYLDALTDPEPDEPAGDGSA